MNTFEAFNNGKLITPAATKDFSNIPWSKHPVFTGVELKHILTSNETGILSIFPANVPHEVNAGEDGLYLFAKFMPALC